VFTRTPAADGGRGRWRHEEAQTAVNDVSVVPHHHQTSKFEGKNWFSTKRHTAQPFQIVVLQICNQQKHAFTSQYIALN
jgi:hypothetical protein